MARLIITRAAPGAQALAAKLKALGHEPLLAPMLEIWLKAYPDAPPGDAQAALVTSANGVRGLCLATERRDTPLIAVGDATAAAARRAGFTKVSSAEGDVDALAALAKRTLDPRGGPVAHVCGEDAAGDLTGVLQGAGFAAVRIIVYRAEPARALPGEIAEALDAADGVLFHSPRGAQTFVALAQAAGLTAQLLQLEALCLSPAVAQAAEPTGWARVRVAARPEEEALLALISQPPRHG